VEGGIGDSHALASEQFANLGEPDAPLQPPPDHVALLGTHGPAIPSRTAPDGMERQQHVAHLVVADRIPVHAQAGRCRRLQIPPHGLRIQSELGGHPFLRETLAPESEHFLEFDHRDLAKHRVPPGLGRSPAQETSTVPSSEGGKVLKNSPHKGGKVLKNFSPEGGKVLQKSSGKGP